MVKIQIDLSDEEDKIVEVYKLMNNLNTKQEANNIFSILSSPLARDFYSALIFWDEKRPIKTSILNSLNLQQFESSQALRLF